MTGRVAGHLVVFLVAVGFVVLLVSGFVRDNLGEDFIGFASNGDGTDHPDYRVGSIVFLFGVMAVPAVLFGAVLWELVRSVGLALGLLLRKR